MKRPPRGLALALSTFALLLMPPVLTRQSLNLVEGPAEATGAGTSPTAMVGDLEKRPAPAAPTPDLLAEPPGEAGLWNTSRGGTVADLQAPPPSAPTIATAKGDLANKPNAAPKQRHAIIMPSPPKPVMVPAAELDLVDKLRQELEHRDAMIASLLRRVEKLERVLTPGELDQTVAGALGATPSAAGMPPLSPQGLPLPHEQRPAQSGDRPQDQAQAQATTRPAPAPGQFEVDGEVADRALERTLVAQGALLVPFGFAELQPNFSYTRREIDLVFSELQRDEFEASLTARLGLPFDSQLDVNFPYQYVDQSEVSSLVAGVEDARSGSGFGDISVGLSKTLLREGRWWPDLVARAFWDTATGKSTEDGVPLNGDFNEVGGSLTALKRQDPLAFVGSVSYEHAFENDNIRPGDELGFSIGAFLAASPETSLRFLLNQSFADDQRIGGQVINGTDQVSSTLTIGAASVLGRGVLVDISGDVGLTDEAPDYAVRISVPIRFDLPILGPG